MASLHRLTIYEGDYIMKQYKKLWALITLLCFALTLFPAAALAANESIGIAALAEVSSVFISDDTSAKVDESVDIRFSFDGQLNKVTTTPNVYVWFVKDGSDVPAIAVTSENGLTQSDIGVFTIPAAKVAEGIKYSFRFSNTGNYTVAAAFNNPADVAGTTAEKVKNVENKITSLSSKKSVEISSKTDSDLYQLQLIDNAGLGFGIKEGDKLANNGSTTIGAGGNLSVSGVNNHLNTNGVASDDITFKLLDKDGKAVKGATVKLSTSNTNCIVNKETVTTDQLGQFKFTIAITEESPNTDGFTLYMECGSYEAKLIITASSTSAHDLTVTKMPQNPISTDDATAGSTLDDIWVAVKDVNGNFVKPFALQPGGKFAEPAFAAVNVSVGLQGTQFDFTTDYVDTWGKSAEEYVSIVSQPAGSELENKDIWLCPVGQDAAYQNTLYTAENLIAGDYTIRVALQNGKHTDISFKIAEMGTPVKLAVTPKAAVMELGSKTSASFDLVDANGVKCDALKKGTDIAVSGYGVLKTQIVEKDNKVDIYSKNDDKYAGKDIKIVATNDRYNLVGESTIQINDGKSFLYCPTTTATVNTPVDLTYLLMNGQNMMNITIGSNAADLAAFLDYDAMPTGTFRVTGGQTSFVVASKPEGAKVNLDARAAGGSISSISGDCYAVGRIESDTIGPVTIRMAIGVEIKQEDGSWSPRYYEGTQTILFTQAGMGKTVIMSIGSNEIIANSDKVSIDAAPTVQNSRTYVPFRALAEAFGAEVAYDEATQAVTAELNGVTVVMTIGSATYTVNDEEQTMDVAPFINGSRTMVPVRFVAEAFGIKVIPTYDQDGATADILFNL